MNAALILFAKAFQLTAPTNNNQRTPSNPRNCQIAQPNQQGYNAWQNGGIQGAQNAGIRVLEMEIKSGATTAEDWVISLGITLPDQEEGMLLIFRLSWLLFKKKKQGFNFKQKNLTSWLLQVTLDKAPVYDTNGSAEIYSSPPEPQLVPQNDSHVTSVAPSMVQSEGTVETSFATNEETRAHQETVYRNLVDQVAQFNMVNYNMRATNAELKYELARYKIQEQRVEIRKFLNEVKSSLVTLQRMVKQKMTLEVHNWSSSAHKEEKEYAVLWNNWNTKCKECKYDKISYDKAYNDMQQKVKRLQAQLRDLKGKSSNTPSASNTLDPLNQKLKSKIIELEFQVVNYEREISHLKTTYKNLFDSIKSNRVHAKLHNLIYENAQLRARLFKNTSEPMNNTSGTSVTPHIDKPKLSAVTPHSKKLHALIPSHSVPQPREFNVVKHRNMIAPGMFKINSSQTPRVDLVPNKQSSASIKTNPITNSQRHVIVKENVSSNTVTASSTGLVHTTRTIRPQPKCNTRNARVPSASKSSEVKKNVTVEDHRRTLMLSKNKKTVSSECNNIKLAIQNDKSEIICDTCKQCLVTANHDACLPSSVNALNSRVNKLCANAPLQLADRSITHPKGVAEDVFVKVGKFHFPIGFVVVDFEADPRVPLILGISFLRTGYALIDIYGEEITLRVNDEAVTFNLNQTSRYSSTYDDFSGSDFILEEIDAYLKDELVSPEIDHADCDPEGNICLIEKLLNNDPFQLPPMDLKQGEAVKAKYLIEEPPEL
nr:reverse transcriptase domain-containing protein [Tanacetum cinerariifolium]